MIVNLSLLVPIPIKGKRDDPKREKVEELIQNENSKTILIQMKIEDYFTTLIENEKNFDFLSFIKFILDIFLSDTIKIPQNFPKNEIISFISNVLVNESQFIDINNKFNSLILNESNLDYSDSSSKCINEFNDLFEDLFEDIFLYQLENIIYLNDIEFLKEYYGINGEFLNIFHQSIICYIIILRIIIRNIDKFIPPLFKDEDFYEEENEEENEDLLSSIIFLYDLNSIMFSKFFLTLIIWNISPPFENIKDQLEKISNLKTSKIPNDIFENYINNFINLNEVVISIIEKFSGLSFQEILINEHLNDMELKRRELNRKVAILSEIFPDKNFDDFELNEDVLTDLFNCLDNEKSKKIDIEKILDETDFN